MGIEIDRSGTQRGTRAGQCPRWRKARVREERDIERLLIWTYQQQRADIVLARGDRDAVYLGGSGKSGDGCADAARAAQLLAIVDTSAYTAADLDPDAETIHDAVARVCGRGALGTLVVQCARAGAPPDCAPVQRLVKVPSAIYDPRRATFRPAIEWFNAHRDYGFCPVQLDPTDAEVQTCRARFVDWHDALAEVRAALKDRLQRYEATGPARPRQPWGGRSMSKTT